jgi:hypothetical protein
MKMLIVWFAVLIVFSVLCGKLSEVPDSSKVSITSHMWVRLGTSWIGAHVPTMAEVGSGAGVKAFGSEAETRHWRYSGTVLFRTSI